MLSLLSSISHEATTNSLTPEGRMTCVGRCVLGSGNPLSDCDECGILQFLTVQDVDRHGQTTIVCVRYDGKKRSHDRQYNTDFIVELVNAVFKSPMEDHHQASIQQWQKETNRPKNIKRPPDRYNGQTVDWFATWYARLNPNGGRGWGTVKQHKI